MTHPARQAEPPRLSNQPRTAARNQPPQHQPENHMPDVLVTQAGPVLEVLFNRPEKKNALTGPMYAAVVEAFRRADADPRDPRRAAQRSRRHVHRRQRYQRLPVPRRDRWASNASPFLDALSSLATPLVAAVNGAAIGVGTTMLAHADLVIAARSARFVMPFTSLGLVPEAASSLLFPRLSGISGPARSSCWVNRLDAKPPANGASSIRWSPTRT